MRFISVYSRISLLFMMLGAAGDCSSPREHPRETEGGKGGGAEGGENAGSGGAGEQTVGSGGIVASGGSVATGGMSQSGGTCGSTCTVGANECASSASLRSCAAGTNGCNVQRTTACDVGLVCERLEPANCADPRWAEWPVPPSTSPTGYTDNGDGTVTDSTTGLMWEKTGTTTSMMQTAAVTYCATMATTGGHGDWRLPSKIELLSIVDYGRSTPSINPIFTGTASAYYWSSTPDVESTSNAWHVSFGFGQTFVDDISTMNNVRCVR